MVTVAIPTRNRAEYLRLAIDSVLAQSYKDIEVVVSDNASEDNTPEVLATYKDRVKVLRQDRCLDMADNWQECLRAATGEYFLLLSDDDLLEPRAIDALISPFSQNDRGVAFAYGRTGVVYPDGTASEFPVVPPVYEKPSDFILECYGTRRFSPTGATLFRTADMREVGGYVWKGLNLVLDASMLMRVALLNKDKYIVFVDEKVFKYRVHSSNATIGASLRVWADEIECLFKEISSRIDGSVEFKKRLVANRDRYLVSFLFHHAEQACKGGGVALKLKTALVCSAVCKPYIKPHSLSKLVIGYLKLVLPEHMVKTIKGIKTMEKRERGKCVR